MPQTIAPPITRYDYEQMPEGPPYYQVIEGELVMSPSPRTPHQYIIGNLYVFLRNYLRDHPIGEVLLAPLDVFLSETNVYQPDLVFVSNERRSLITDHGIEGAPDLVIEVLSPGTARFDRGSKRKIYARTGVQELWLVDPDGKRIQIYRLTEDADAPAATYAANAVFESPLLPGLRIEAAEVFKSSHGA
ncbi:MAG: Uma2 family endonuclease [Verrucomicrobia bacterium]|nr:Uma2 family endonuclease [Verrucomicrobiota bacterium]